MSTTDEARARVEFSIAVAEERKIGSALVMLDDLRALLAQLSAVTAERDTLQGSSLAPWGDAPDQWSEAIEKAHPVNSGSSDHYQTGMDMVRTRRSKHELVALINWLLIRCAKAEAALRSPRG